MGRSPIPRREYAICETADTRYGSTRTRGPWYLHISVHFCNNMAPLAPFGERGWGEGQE
jgi:hypothetical protein